MIVKKEWIKSKHLFKDSVIEKKYVYKGYFLLGIIPMYIERKGAYSW